MNKTDKTAYIQLEKAYESLYKVKVKMDLIDKHYDEMFITNDDYQSLKQSYLLEEKYATLKCKDIISNNQTLKENRKNYKNFSIFYKAKKVFYDIALVFIPLFIGGLVYSILENERLIWLFASLCMITLGIIGYVYFNKPKYIEEYMGPTSMQVKVLKRIDSLLISGQIYEEIIKDCQLQFAKRKLINQAKEKSNYAFDLTETNTYPKYEENYIYAYSSLTNIKNLSSLSDYYKNEKSTVKATRKKASDSSVYAKYIKPKTTKKIAIEKKKASDSTVYAKYMTKNNKKEVLATKKKASESPTYLKYMSNDSMSSKFKSKKTVVARYEGNSTITRVAIDIEKPKTARKKASDSAIYQKYLQQKQKIAAK